MKHWALACLQARLLREHLHDNEVPNGFRAGTHHLQGVRVDENAQQGRPGHCQPIDDLHKICSCEDHLKLALRMWSYWFGVCSAKIEVSLSIEVALHLLFEVICTCQSCFVPQAEVYVGVVDIHTRVRPASTKGINTIAVTLTGIQWQVKVTALLKACSSPIRPHSW